MKHKVTCMDCGKVEYVVVERGKKVESDWIFYGKVCLNPCTTDKFHFKIRDGGTMLNPKDWIKIVNPNYDSAVKRKIAEMWSCPQCQQKQNLEEMINNTIKIKQETGIDLLPYTCRKITRAECLTKLIQIGENRNK